MKKLPPPRKPGRPVHVPSAQDRRMVRVMAAHGIDQGQIAGVLAISAATLRKHFRQELDIGLTELTARMAMSVYDAALRGNLKAIMFWLRARAGWSDRSPPAAASTSTPAPTPARRASRQAAETPELSAKQHVKPSVATAAAPGRATRRRFIAEPANTPLTPQLRTPGQAGRPWQRDPASMPNRSAPRRRPGSGRQGGRRSLDATRHAMRTVFAPKLGAGGGDTRRPPADAPVIPHSHAVPPDSMNTP